MNYMWRGMGWCISFLIRTLQDRSVPLAYLTHAAIWTSNIRRFLLFPQAKTCSSYAKDDYDNQSPGASDDCPNNDTGRRLLGGLATRSGGLGYVRWTGIKVWIPTIPGNKEFQKMTNFSFQHFKLRYYEYSKTHHKHNLRMHQSGLVNKNEPIGPIDLM